MASDEEGEILPMGLDSLVLAARAVVDHTLAPPGASATGRASQPCFRRQNRCLTKYHAKMAHYPVDFRLDIAASSPYLLFPIWRAGRRLRRQPRQVREEATVTVVPGVRLSESAKLQALRFFIWGGARKTFPTRMRFFRPAGLPSCRRGPSNTLSLPLLGCFQAFQRNAVVRHKRSCTTTRQEGPYNSFLTSFAADILLTSKLTALPDGGSGGFNPPAGSKGRSPLPTPSPSYLSEAALLIQLTSGPSGGYKGLQNRRVGGPFQGVPCVYS